MGGVATAKGTGTSSGSGDVTVIASASGGNGGKGGADYNGNGGDGGKGGDATATATGSSSGTGEVRLRLWLLVGKEAVAAKAVPAATTAKPARPVKPRPRPPEHLRRRQRLGHCLSFRRLRRRAGRGDRQPGKRLFCRSKATAPVSNGTSQAAAGANVGQPVMDLAAAQGKQAAAFGTALPDKSSIDGLLAQSPAVQAAFTGDGAILGYGVLGGSAARAVSH